MNAQRPDGHTKGTHSLIGVGAALLGVVLGIGVVYWDGVQEKTLIVQAAGINAECVGYDPSCQYPEYNQSKTKQCLLGKPCKEPDGVGGFCTGTCQADGKCLGSACNGQGLEGKPKEMPMMGGMPPMLPMIPMGMPKMDMPMPMQNQETDPCKREPKPSYCPNTGISGLLGNIFGTSTASSTGNAIKNTVTSVANKLSNFLSGSADTSSTQNPTKATVVPITPSGSNAGTLTTGGTQAAPSGTTVGGEGATNQAVTGFGASGSGQATADTSTGPILSAMTGIIQKIQSLLSSLF